MPEEPQSHQRNPLGGDTPPPQNRIRKPFPEPDEPGSSMGVIVLLGGFILVVLICAAIIIW